MGLVLLSACGSSDKPNHPAVDAGSGEPDASGELAMDAGDVARDASTADPASMTMETAVAEPAAPEGCPFSPPTVCPDPKPTYADVQPIFEQRCVGCHDGMHGQWSLADYEHIADWFVEVRSQLIACTMPPVASGMSMPVSERMQILTWLRCGFPK